jgi:hypothetical protein
VCKLRTVSRMGVTPVKETGNRQTTSLSPQGILSSEVFGICVICVICG